MARWRTLYGLVLEAAPQVFSILAFASGAVMIASAVQPPFGERLQVLQGSLPILVVELSHFLASVVGFLLLLVAAGLWRRRRGAYWSALGLLIAGAAFSLAKGLDVEEASILIAVAALLLPCGPAFYRASVVDALALSTRTFLVVGALVGGELVLGLLSYADAPYADHLWWTFLWDADFSRTLRAGAAIVLMTVGFAVVVMVHGARAAALARPTDAQLRRALTILETARARPPEAWLAVLGDKSLMFSDSGRSFLAYRARGSRWVVMGEPAGAPEEFLDLVWRLVERADRAGAKVVFYAVADSFLPLLAAVGMTIRKVGETAAVSTAGFTLSGKPRQDLRTALNRLKREGVAVEVLPAGSAAPLAPALQAVSDAWLSAGRGVEKAFSLGSFDPDYLDRTPLVVARRGETLVGFANLLPGAAGERVQVDLMRHTPDAPPGVMDAMFVQAIEWSRAQGFAAFDLGMAPLAGLGARRLSPMFYRLADLAFELGEPFYGFKGLRSYKAKFGPEWRPVFMAAAPGVPMVFALLDVVLLTNGGWPGLLGLRRRTAPPRGVAQGRAHAARGKAAAVPAGGG